MRIVKTFKPGLLVRNIIPPAWPENLMKAWSKVTSLMVVRHPLDRLVSLYNNKFIHRVKDNQLWAEYASDIIRNYRDESDSNLENITPEEMIR